MYTVLVVDDDVIVRNTIAAMLISLKHDVIHANDGAEACSVYKILQFKISVVIMDVKMPRMNGVEATKIIKEFNSDAKIILTSGDTIPYSAKASAFLPKPFTRKELGDIVQLVMKTAS